MSPSPPLTLSSETRWSGLEKEEPYQRRAAVLSTSEEMTGRKTEDGGGRGQGPPKWGEWGIWPSGTFPRGWDRPSEPEALPCLLFLNPLCYFCLLLISPTPLIKKIKIKSLPRERFHSEETKTKFSWTKGRWYNGKEGQAPWIPQLPVSTAPAFLGIGIPWWLTLSLFGSGFHPWSGN